MNVEDTVYNDVNNSVNPKVWKSADDRVLVQRIESAEKTTAGGLVLPEKVGAGVQRGIVLAAGPNAAGVLAGDLVYYMQKSAIPVEIGIFSVYASDVIAIQREE